MPSDISIQNDPERDEAIGRIMEHLHQLQNLATLCGVDITVRANGGCTMPGVQIAGAPLIMSPRQAASRAYSLIALNVNAHRN